MHTCNRIAMEFRQWAHSIPQQIQPQEITKVKLEIWLWHFVKAFHNENRAWPQSEGVDFLVDTFWVQWISESGIKLALIALARSWDNMSSIISTMIMVLLPPRWSVFPQFATRRVFCKQICAQFAAFADISAAWLVAETGTFVVDRLPIVDHPPSSIPVSPLKQQIPSQLNVLIVRLQKPAAQWRIRESVNRRIRESHGGRVELESV